MSDDEPTARDADEAPQADAYTKLSTKVKRGTGTRDQDTTKLVTRHPDPMKAVARHQRALDGMENSAETARLIQTDD